MHQCPLLDPAPPAQRHSETSVAAALAIEPAAGTLRAEVLACLRRCGPQGATDEEMQWDMRMGPNTQRPRRVELVDRGLVVDSGLRRRTAAGRRAVVWRAV